MKVVLKEEISWEKNAKKEKYCIFSPEVEKSRGKIIIDPGKLYKYQLVEWKEVTYVEDKYTENFFTVTEYQRGKKISEQKYYITGSILPEKVFKGNFTSLKQGNG